MTVFTPAVKAAILDVARTTLLAEGFHAETLFTDMSDIDPANTNTEVLFIDGLAAIYFEHDELYVLDDHGDDDVRISLANPNYATAVVDAIRIIQQRGQNFTQSRMSMGW